MRKELILPWMLIIAGTALLLHQLHLFRFRGINIFIVVSFALGVLLFVRGVGHPLKSGIFGGSFFILLASWLLLMRIGILPIDDYLAGGLFFATLGAANLVHFAFAPGKISSISVGVIFILVSLPFFFFYYGYFPRWNLEDFYLTYWPVALILIGVGLMADGLIRRIHR